MRHIRVIAGVCCVVSLVSGCATNHRVEDVRHASAAYEAVAAAAESLLDELAIAERHGEINAPPEGTRTLTEGDVTVYRQFDPSRAASYASIGEPPSTAQQRRGLKIVGSYIEVLEVLVEGRNIDEAKGRIQILAADIGSLGTLVTGGASAFVATFIGAIGPVIEAAARAQNAEELRAVVLKGQKPIAELIGSLIASTPNIYRLLIRDSESAADGRLLKNPVARYGELLKIRGYHGAVANYVVLLQRLQGILVALASNMREPGGVPLAALSATSNELVRQAESVRRAYGILRRSAAAAGIEETTR